MPRPARPVLVAKDLLGAGRAATKTEREDRERGGARMLGYGSAFCVPAPVVSCMNMKWSYNPHQTTK